MLSEPIVRIQEGPAGSGHDLFGYCAVFGVFAEINSYEGKFLEEFQRGAFSKTLQERTPIMQFDHGYDPRVGSVPIGVFESITQDQVGVHVEGRLFDNPVVEPVRQAIESAAISGMSIRFQVVKEVWRDNKGKIVKGEELLDLLWMPGERGPLQRTIKEVKLAEAGPVVFPAYTSTSVGVRAGLVGITDDELRQRRESLAPQRLHVRS